MAVKYDWGDGNGKIHTVSLKQHQDDLKAQAAAAIRAANPQTTAAATALLGNPQSALKGQVAPAEQAAVTAPLAATAPDAAPAPVAPPLVQPFFTADDLDAINQFNTDLQTKLTGLDTGLANAETDTTYQKTQNETAAKQSSSAATDDAISRGIFASSIKDANLYDIEAQRSLAQKFLDDKLTTARLDAGTNKQTLATAKTNFDTNMVTRKVQNAQGINDVNNTAYAAAQAAWAQANPVSTPTGPAPAAPSFKPSAPVKGQGPQVPLSTGPRPVNVSETQNGTTAKPKVKTTKIVYGNTP